MDNNNITPGDAIWILRNLSNSTPPVVMPTAWANHRKRIVAKLQRIVDSAAGPIDCKQTKGNR